MTFNRIINYIQRPHKIDFYRIFTYFFMCAFIGWFFETLVVFLETGQLTYRGLLFFQKNYIDNIQYIQNIPIVWGLPLIEIYGYGGVIIFFVIGKFKYKTWQLFFIGTVLMTLLELISSYFCEYVIHQTFWDYSNQVLNFQGRICLRSSLTWGILTVFSIKYLKPKLDSIYEKEKTLKIFKQINITLALYTLICMLFKYFW